MGDKEHHVHFSGASGLGKDNNIMIQPQRHGHIDVHLGFLQLHHRFTKRCDKLNVPRGVFSSMEYVCSR